MYHIVTSHKFNPENKRFHGSFKCRFKKSFPPINLYIGELMLISVHTWSVTMATKVLGGAIYYSNTTMIRYGYNELINCETGM